MADENDIPLGSVAPKGALPLPRYAVTAPIKRGRGRPKKINPRPTQDDLEYHAEISQQKKSFIENDPLVAAAISRQDPIEVLHKIKVEVAKEAAALLFMRIEEEKYGKDTAQISTRRIAALKELTTLESELRLMGSAVIDLKSEQFQKIFKFFIETITEVSLEVLSKEQTDLFFNRLETKLDGWEERAQDKLR